MRILQLASEAVPFAKTGGLGDVVGALSRHLAAAGHEVHLVLPLYRSIAASGLAAGATPVLELAPPDLGTVEEGRLVSGPPLDAAHTWFVDVPELFDREGLYGTGHEDHPDNLLRFAAFVRAVLLSVPRAIPAPDVLHCHDWQTALAPVWLSDTLPTVLTIHNLSYQGWFPAAVRIDADAALGDGPRARRLPGAADLNLLRLGLQAADRVTTVSPTYAEEIQRPEHGCGLADVLRGLDPPVSGILNGIDTDAWDPANDPHLPAPYAADDLSGKREAREALLREFELAPPDDGPVFGLVSRLVEQKGIGLLAELRERFAGWTGARFILLGTGERRYEDLLAGLGELPHVGARVAFDERLAHLVEGGADFFLMPSAFEPCGLNQMLSQRYGTVPIVHRTGGLSDSVMPATPAALQDGTASGIVFEHHDAAGLAWAIDEAFRLYADRPTFTNLQAAIMRIDNSWEARLPAYEALYQSVAAGASGGARSS